MKNFGEFYNDQIENAGTIFLSRTAGMPQDKIDKAVELLREKNPNAVIVTTDWSKLTGEQMIKAMEEQLTLEKHLHELENQQKHHHHDHDDDCGCGCHDHHDHEHHHHDHDDCDCGCHDHHDHEHHHHDHDDDCGCGCHDHHEHEHHHHDHDDDCGCGCHDHHDHEHHHHHHADEVFTSCGMETTHKFTAEQITDILKALENEEEYGIILRAKGIVENADGSWIHFDYVPACPDVRSGSAEIIGRICVIGSKLNEDKIKALFGV